MAFRRMDQADLIEKSACFQPKNGHGSVESVDDRRKETTCLHRTLAKELMADVLPSIQWFTQDEALAKVNSMEFGI